MWLALSGGEAVMTRHVACAVGWKGDGREARRTPGLGEGATAGRRVPSRAGWRGDRYWNAGLRASAAWRFKGRTSQRAGESGEPMAVGRRFLGGADRAAICNRL